MLSPSDLEPTRVEHQTLEGGEREEGGRRSGVDKGDELNGKGCYGESMTIEADQNHEMRELTAMCLSGMYRI